MSLYQDQRPNPSAAATGGSAAAPQTPGNNAAQATSGPSSLRRQILDLRRLLHAMSRPNGDANNHDDDVRLPPYVIRDRMDLSQSMLSHIRHTMYQQARSDRVAYIDALAAEADNAHLNIDYERLMRQVEQMREEHARECQREDVTMEELRRDVDVACRDAEEQLHIAKETDGDSQQEKDIIDVLFISTNGGTVNDVGGMQHEGRARGASEGWMEDDGASDDYSLGLSDDIDDNANAAAPAPEYDGTPRPSSPRNATTTSHQPNRNRNRHHHSHNPNHVTDQSEDVKRQQAEMLETEIAEMAAQMKSATLRMNTTLKEQSNALDDMEDVVTENLDNVADVTTKVESHVRRGWKKTAKTWSLLFSVIGTFAFLFVTMRAAPKRRDACLFFCDRSRNGRYRDDKYEIMYSAAEEERLRLLEELRMRNSEADDDTAARGDEGGGNDDDEGDMVCETLGNGSVQCFGVREKTMQDRKSRRQKTDEASARSVSDDPGCGGEPDDSQRHDEVLAGIEDDATKQPESESGDDAKPESEQVNTGDEEDSKDETSKVEYEALTEEERQEQKKEDKQRREMYAKKRAIEDEIRVQRERQAIEDMERLKREKNKEADMKNAEAFKAYSSYKKRAREELLEQKKKRDSFIEKEEAQRLAEAERIAAETAEQERLGAKSTNAEDTIKAEPLEAERYAEAERIDADNAEQEQLEQAHITTEKANQERLEQERTSAEKVNREQLGQERIATETAEQERLERERTAAEKANWERLAQKQIAAEKANRKRLKNEQIAAEKANQKRLEEKRVAAEEAEQERLEAVRIAEAERLAAERANAERADRKRATEKAKQRAEAKQRSEAKLHDEADGELAAAEKKAEELVRESEEERLRKEKQATARAKVEREMKKAEESQKGGARSEL